MSSVRETSLREGLGPPQRQLIASERNALISYLDRQSRVRLALWASHEHPTVDGLAHDHHLLLGIDDSDWHGEHGWALERGIDGELGGYADAWLDLFAMADADAAREVGEVVWTPADLPSSSLDPLDFRFTWEALCVEDKVATAFAGLARDIPTLLRVEACRERLWKNGAEVLEKTQFFVEFAERRPQDFEQVTNALREAGVDMLNTAMTVSPPWKDTIRTAVLYER